ncbi:MAG: EAL domain-containing protein [Desulfobacterales bacterium]
MASGNRANGFQSVEPKEKILDRQNFHPAETRVGRVALDRVGPHNGSGFLGQLRNGSPFISGQGGVVSEPVPHVNGEGELCRCLNTNAKFARFFSNFIIRQIHLPPKRSHQMVSTFVKAAQDLGIATIAEGIECSNEAETCQRLGFNFAQGFFYGRPLPITEIH